MATLSDDPKKRALEEIADERERRGLGRADICDWAERHFYISATRQQIILMLHQKAILRAMMKLDPDGARHWITCIYSTIKKSGKSTVGGLIGRFIAEVLTHMGEIYTVGNDWRQAKERSFRFLEESIRLTPGVERRSGEWHLPDRWHCQKTKMECLTTQSKVEAISVDAAGEAGGAPDLSIWTELWGMESTESLRFWDEMTPVATKPNSFRVVETYAGYDGESVLLQGLYELGKDGRQLTNHELATMAARPDVPGETYEDFLGAFVELAGDPEALVPVWVNEDARLFMYWDSGDVARRMPWQRGVGADAYYREEQHALTPAAYDRLHRNLWSAPEGVLIPMEVWDRCKEDLPPFVPENQEPVVLSADAAATQDNFGIIAVTRHPTRPDDPAIRAVRKWVPPRGGSIDFQEPEEFLRLICLGGCVAGHHWKREDCDACQSTDERQKSKAYNVVEIAYDDYQLHDMMQRLRRDHVAWCRPFDQGKDRLTADRGLVDMASQRRLAHDGNEELREHIENAVAKYESDQDSKLRIVKKGRMKKVDLAVCASMGVHEVLRLNL